MVAFDCMSVLLDRFAMFHSFVCVVVWFQVAVAPDGGCGAVCEHSAVDGTCTVPVTEFALKNW